MNDVLDKLLIIDDLPIDLQRLSGIFSHDFKCLTATSGEDGLIIFKSELPYLVLCDVKMPGGMSGFQVSQKIKSKSPSTILILVSSYGDTDTKKRGYQVRADAYIDKDETDEIIFMQVMNFYNTKKGNKAEFIETETTYNVDKILNFESEINSLLKEYYDKSIYSERPKEVSLSFIVKNIRKKQSKRTIERNFKKHTGKTFGEFHRDFKLKFSTNLLIKTDKSIKEIHEQLNYESHSTFSREFKKKYNITPSKYRQNDKKSKK